MDSDIYIYIYKKERKKEICVSWEDWFGIHERIPTYCFHMRMLDWLATKMSLLDLLVFIKKYHIIGFYIGMLDWSEIDWQLL
jgi:hypothetical protein